MYLLICTLHWLCRLFEIETWRYIKLLS